MRRDLLNCGLQRQCVLITSPQGRRSLCHVQLCSTISPQDLGKRNARISWRGLLLQMINQVCVVPIHSMETLPLSDGAILVLGVSSVLRTLFCSSADNYVCASNMMRLMEAHVPSFPWFGMTPTRVEPDHLMEPLRVGTQRMRGEPNVRYQSVGVAICQPHFQSPRPQGFL